jgi:hypothetical protein
MAAWRRRAVELLGEAPGTANEALFELLPLVFSAHRRGDDHQLREIYAFAQWCHHQRAGSALSNAAAVSFYEHLFDDWSLREAVVPWLSPSVREAILPLWERRLPPARAQDLLTLLAREEPTRWRELRDDTPSAARR